MDKGRTARRLKANMRAWIRTESGTAFQAQIADISITGCRLLGRNLPRLEGRLVLTIIDADLTAVSEPVWQNGFAAGLRFVLHGTQAEMAELQARGADPVPTALRQAIRSREAIAAAKRRVRR